MGVGDGIVGDCVGEVADRIVGDCVGEVADCIVGDGMGCGGISGEAGVAVSLVKPVWRYLR